MNCRAALFVALRILGSGIARIGKVPRRGARRPRGEARYLRGAIAGIALSLVPFVVVLVVADGMIQGISKRYLETWSYHLQASPLRLVPPEDSYRAASRIKERVPGIVGAWPELRGAAVVFSQGRTASALVRGIDPAWLNSSGARTYLTILSGSSTIVGRQVLVGNEMAKALGIGAGDSLSVVTAGSELGRLKPRATLFRVAGVISAGYRDLDELWIFIPYEVAERILPPYSSQHMIGIKVEQPYGNLEALRPDLNRALSSGPDIPAEGTDWILRSWKEIERNLFASFATTRFLLLVIMGLSICVAAINVSSALAMLSIERSRDIAILKSAGASRGFISVVFLLAGGVTGMIGTAIGLSLGAILALRVNNLISLLEMGLSSLVRLGALITGAAVPASIRLLDPAYYLEKIPVQLDAAQMGLVAAATMALCLLASVIPALRAARQSPLEIFRKT